MDQRQIYLARFLKRLEVGPTIISAGINRYLNAIGKKRSKIVFFSTFSYKLGVLLDEYRLDILIQGKG